MFVIHQKVILPKSHNEKEGTVVVVPKHIRIQSGLSQNKDRVKVSYLTVGGGMTEAWFPITGDKAITAWKAPKDIKKELEAKHQQKMEEVAAEHDREKLDWIEGQAEVIEPLKDTDGEIIPDTEEVTKVSVEDVKVIETPATAETDKIAARASVKSKATTEQVIPTDRVLDNSDKFIG